MESFLVPGLLLLAVKFVIGDSCVEPNPFGCQGNPKICENEMLAVQICPVTCNRCPTPASTTATTTQATPAPDFYCYHCDQPVSDVSRCTNVTACADDKRCLNMHATSSIDGRDEFTLKCVEAAVCNTERMVHKRNVQMTCCTGNYCNKLQTTTTTSTTTILLTTKAQDCYKDVIFINEESQNIGNVGPAKQFMHDVISGLEIGITKALTALLVNRADAIVWNLNGHYTKNESLNAVNQLQQEVAPQNPDPLDGLETYINHAHFVSFGNRHDKADVVILETTVDAADHTGFLFSSRTKGQIIEKLHTLSNNVIVFGIGHLFQRSNLREIATDDEHLFLLNDVTELPSYVERAKSLICS